MDLGQVVAQHDFAMAAHGLPECLLHDIRIAISITANPIAHAENRRDPVVFGLVLNALIEPWDFLQKGALIVRNRVFDFVFYREFG